MTLAVLSALLGLVATFACLVPALRAGRTNPLDVLRRD
jgi:ABC-type lipoprotein release transport system permease subunit